MCYVWQCYDRQQHSMYLKSCYAALLSYVILYFLPSCVRLCVHFIYLWPFYIDFVKFVFFLFFRIFILFLFVFSLSLAAAPLTTVKRGGDGIF